MAHTKAKGTTKLGRDSISKRLGVKLADGQTVKPGNIIVRQRGTKYLPGEGTLMGNDYTIYATKPGKVSFGKKMKKHFTGRNKIKTVISVN